VIAGTLAATETVSWGVLYYAFSVFLVPMQEDLGWSPATLTGAYSLALLLSGLAAPFVGRWLDRHGPRALMTAGSVLGALLVVAWAAVDTRVAYYLVWAGLGLAMAATLYEPAFATLARWFERDRPRAMLIVTVAAGFASTIFLPLAAWLVARVDWRPALLILAAILATTTILPHALLLRRRPEDLGLLPDGRRGEGGDRGWQGVTGVPSPPEAKPAPSPHASLPPATPSVSAGEALRDRTFWWLTAALCLEATASVAVGVSMVPYLTERGDGAGFAAAATGLIGAAQVGARVLATLGGGRLSQVALTALVFVLQAVALVVLIGWQERAGVLTAVLLLGAGRGVVTLMRAGLVAEFYGRAHFGAISGMLALFLTGARSLAPIGVGVAYGISGGYEPVLWAMAVSSLLAAAAMVGVGRQRRMAALRPTRQGW
jgi:hypothetical protein